MRKTAIFLLFALGACGQTYKIGPEHFPTEHMSDAQLKAYQAEAKREAEVQAGTSEAPLVCQYEGIRAGAGGSMYNSIVGQITTTNACMEIYRRTGRLPGRG